MLFFMTGKRFVLLQFLSTLLICKLQYSNGWIGSPFIDLFSITLLSSNHQFSSSWLSSRKMRNDDKVMIKHTTKEFGLIQKVRTKSSLASTYGYKKRIITSMRMNENIAHDDKVDCSNGKVGTNVQNEGVIVVDKDKNKESNKIRNEKKMRNKRSRKNASITKKKKKERPRVPILQYHDQWVCVNKPAGITIYRSFRARAHNLVLSTLLKRQLSRKVYPVHRLDHRTSGAILFAFDSKTCADLHASLTSTSTPKNENGNETSSDDRADTNESEALKEYIALVRGDCRYLFSNKEETNNNYFLTTTNATDASLDNNVLTIDKPLNVSGVMKDARTEFYLLASTSSTTNNTTNATTSSGHDLSSCSLLLCRPKTGRTHQIRRHLREVSHPIIGDSQHGDSRVNRWWRENRNLDRLFLHCFSLDLPPLSSSVIANESVQSDEENIDKVTMISKHQQNSPPPRIQCIAPLLSDLSDVLKSEPLSDVWQEALSKDSRLSTEPYDIRGGTFGRHYRKNNMNKEQNTL